MLPLQGIHCRLKDALFHVAIVVFAFDNESEIFRLFNRVVAFQDKTIIFCLDKRELAGNAGNDRTHALSDSALKSFFKGHLLLIESSIF